MEHPGECRGDPRNAQRRGDGSRREYPDPDADGYADAEVARLEFHSPLTAHAWLELAAYVAGFALMQRERKRCADPVPDDQRWSLVVAAILGALAGAKLVHWTNEIPHVLAHAGELETWVGGKSMVGALIGGTFAVELVKRRLGIARRTGDVYVFPLIVSIAIGRLGCFAAGLADHTYGSATTLPWGVDFGDGILRHPTQLYEVAFLMALGAWIAGSRALDREGARFDAFFFAYLGARFALDFLKPYPRIGGLCGTQIWCLLAIAARIAWSAPRRSTREVLS